MANHHVSIEHWVHQTDRIVAAIDRLTRAVALAATEKSAWVHSSHIKAAQVQLLQLAALDKGGDDDSGTV